MNNCPNCGAPLEPYKCKCEYCGTWYYDLSMFTLDDGKPQYVKFKTNLYGHDIYITALTKPTLDTIEINNENTSVADYNGNLVHSVVTGRTVDFNVRFSCLQDYEKEKLLQIIMEDKT